MTNFFKSFTSNTLEGETLSAFLSSFQHEFMRKPSNNGLTITLDSGTIFLSDYSGIFAMTTSVDALMTALAIEGSAPAGTVRKLILPEPPPEINSELQRKARMLAESMRSRMGLGPAGSPGTLGEGDSNNSVGGDTDRPMRTLGLD